MNHVEDPTKTKTEDLLLVCSLKPLNKVTKIHSLENVGLMLCDKYLFYWVTL